MLIGAGAVAALAGGCGTEKPESGNRGAQLFSERCGGCHTLSGGRHAGQHRASGPTGPNLDQRHETPNQVLYAIRNGGFSGAIMPQNIVVGDGRQGGRRVRRQERRHQGQEPALAQLRGHSRRAAARRRPVSSHRSRPAARSTSS